MQLIELLEQTRKDKELTQSEMAARLDVSESYYSYLINGKRTINRRTLAGIIQSFPELEPVVIQALRGEN